MSDMFFYIMILIFYIIIAFIFICGMIAIYQWYLI
jgi:hypothetical protein